MDINSLIINCKFYIKSDLIRVIAKGTSVCKAVKNTPWPVIRNDFLCYVNAIVFFLFFVLLCCFLLVYITINIGRRVTQETKFSLKNLNYITVIVTSVFQNTWVIKTIVLRFLSPVEQNCAKRYLPTINRDQKKIAFNFVQHICQSKFIQCLLIFAKREYVYGFYLTSVSNNSAYQTNSKQAACIRIDIRSCR